MAYTYQTYTGTGSLTTFPISFDWITSTDVVVTVDGLVKVLGTHYSIVAKNVVFTAAPAAGLSVKVSRSSNLVSRNVDFVNGSRLDETDLDNSAKQFFYLLQEQSDKITDVAEDVSNAASALLGTDSVQNVNIIANAVTASKIADGAVGTSEIAALAVTPAKLSTDVTTGLLVAKLYTTSNPTAAGAVTFSGVNIASVTRGATAGLYTIVLTSGTAAPFAAFMAAASANANFRIISCSGANLVIQAYVGAVATDMQFSGLLG
jgi:hypothetical protein